MENPKDRGTWQATVHRIEKSWTRLNTFFLSFVAKLVKNLPAMQKTQVQSLGWEDPLEMEIVTQSSILAWRIPLTEEPGRVQSMGSQESDTT